MGKRKLTKSERIAKQIDLFDEQKIDKSKEYIESYIKKQLSYTLSISKNNRYK